MAHKDPEKRREYNRQYQREVRRKNTAKRIKSAEKIPCASCGEEFPRDGSRVTCSKSCSVSNKRAKHLAWMSRHPNYINEYYARNSEALNASYRRWQERNPERSKEVRDRANARWLHDNIETVRRRAREYSTANRDKRRQYARQWSARNREAMRVYSRAYYVKHRDRILKRQRLRHNNPPMTDSEVERFLTHVSAIALPKTTKAPKRITK